MPAFDEIVNKAKEIAHTAGDKSQEVYEVAKLKIEISSLERKLDTNYVSMGKQCYNSIKNNEDFPDFKASVEEVDLLKADISEKQDQINRIKNTVKCESCGAEVASDNSFCPKCGAKLD